MQCAWISGNRHAVFGKQVDQRNERQSHECIGIVARHAQIYADEYGWTEPFEGLCAQIVADFVNNYDPKLERCWIAEANGENVGCVTVAP